MLTGVEVLTTLVVTGKVAVVVPAATVTLPGTVAAALSLKSVTAAPPAGAGPLSPTVPVAEFPPTSASGVRLSEISPTPESTLSVAGWEV